MAYAKVAQLQACQECNTECSINKYKCKQDCKHNLGKNIGSQIIKEMDSQLYVHIQRHTHGLTHSSFQQFQEYVAPLYPELAPLVISYIIMSFSRVTEKYAKLKTFLLLRAP